jgi:hypothetical protein
MVAGVGVAEFRIDGRRRRRRTEEDER